ncbi:phenazine biosynthesis protein PhzF, partial [Xanthomonas citri pv. citri]|nr:phenazine biosynthesis protein PhzF [Xanthomonas citri pv. citri]
MPETAAPAPRTTSRTTPHTTYRPSPDHVPAAPARR